MRGCPRTDPALPRLSPAKKRPLVDCGYPKELFSNLRERERSALTQRRVAEGVNLVAKRMRQTEPQAIVGSLVELKCATSLETEAAAKEHKWNVVVRVAIAFSEFVRPNDRRIIQHCA